MRLFLHYGDLADSLNLTRLIDRVGPDEIYHLGAQSHVRVSFDIPEYTGDVTGLGDDPHPGSDPRSEGAGAVLPGVSSSEMFGKVQAVPQTETTPFWPRSPYAVAKVYAYWATVNYRESYGMHASNGILFNHESPRRGETFVTRKITRAVAAIKNGQAEGALPRQPRCEARLGLRAGIRRGHVADAAAGQSRTITCWRRTRRTPCGNSVEVAFGHVGLDWQEFVKYDARYERPAEVDLLIGDPAKARKRSSAGSRRCGSSADMACSHCMVDADQWRRATAVRSAVRRARDSGT